MKSLIDRDGALAQGLAAIRQDFQIDGGFPATVSAAANQARFADLSGHADRTNIPFVTLDPQSATDLDQAFAFSRSGADILLHYAIADVASFVEPGDVVDQEAWTRGTTQYLPDGRAGLYPPVLSEGAISLLPDGDRAAVLFHVRVAPDGSVQMDGIERAMIRSRAKLAYDAVTVSDLPDGFSDVARRVRAAEAARGASRIDPPEQEVTRQDDGRFALRFRPRLQSEDDNAALSLATNLAVAQLLVHAQTGLFRVMPEPDDAAVARLRQTARAFSLDWPATRSLTEFERGLSPDRPADASMMMAIRRAGQRAAYAPFDPATPPWHSAIAAPYAHATAPLRRLADRYVIEAAHALANACPVPDWCVQAFDTLPPVMARADALAGRVDRAVVDLAEALVLSGREGESFCAIVTDVDERGLRLQFCDLAIVARLPAKSGTMSATVPGDRIRVTLNAVDVTRRSISLSAN